MSAQWIEVGALARGHFRRELTKAGIRYTETKGLMSSVMILDCPREQYLRICRMIEDAKREAK